MSTFRTRFGANNRLGELRRSPALAYRADGSYDTVYLFDLLRADGPTVAPPPIRNPGTLCPSPAEPPQL
jgi:hypothetical protein